MKYSAKKRMCNRITAFLLVAVMIIACLFDVGATVKAGTTTELEDRVFSYAYDIQRSPAFPKQGQTITASGLANPINTSREDRIASAGSWTLTKIGTYSIIRKSDKDSNNLQRIVTNIAEQYDGVTENEIVIHELKQSGKHIAYGVTLAYDSTNGLAVYLGDALSGGAGYLFSTASKSGEVTIVANFDVTNWVPPTTYKITVSPSENGTTTTSISETIAGDNVTIHVSPSATYMVDSVKYNDGTEHIVYLKDGKYTFVMPEHDVTVKVTYKHAHAKGTKHDAVEGNCVDKGVLEYYDCANGCGNKLDATGAVLTNTEGTTNPNNHKTTMIKTEKIPATVDCTGIKEYWTCKSCGMSYADEAGTILIGDASALESWKENPAGGQIERLEAVNNEENNEAENENPEPPKETKPTSSKTGDNSPMAMWFALLFVSGGLLTVTGIYVKKKRSFAK